MNEIIPVQPALDGEIDYCSCEAIGNEGHTFDCIMEQIRRKNIYAASAAASANFREGQTLV